MVDSQDRAKESNNIKTDGRKSTGASRCVGGSLSVTFAFGAGVLCSRMRKSPFRTFGTPFPKLAIDLFLLTRTLLGRFLLPSMLAFCFLRDVRSLFFILLIFNGELRLESSSGLERLLPFA